MSHTLAKLLCVAALGALAVPVYAQTPQADVKSTEATQATTSSPTAAGAPAAISAEEKAARAACESKPAAEKDKCLKDVDAKYAKAAPDKMAPSPDKMTPSGDMATKPKEDTTKSGSYK